MSHDKEKRGSADGGPARRISDRPESYEVRYLVEQLGATPEAVKAAIGRVGYSRMAIQAELERPKR